MDLRTDHARSGPHQHVGTRCARLRDGYVSALLPGSRDDVRYFHRHRYRPDFIDVGLEPV